MQGNLDIASFLENRKQNIIIIFIKQKYHMQANSHSRDKKIIKNRKRSTRNSQELQLNKLFLLHQKSQFMKVQEETSEEERNNFTKSNIDLFFQKSQSNRLLYPSSFALIKQMQHVEYNNVTIEDLKQPNFPVLSYKINQLIDFQCFILRLNSYTKQCLTDFDLLTLIKLIAQNYNPVSYHNFSHAFNLMLINFQCIEKQPVLKKMYTEEEIFYIMIAAISHDLGHKGTNNQFQIKCQSELAKASNNESVLENMHIKILWMILEQNPHINFLSSSRDPKNAKEIITRLILNTDMAYHFKNLSKLKSLKANNQLQLEASSQHKWLIMEEIFHASDIGNPCLEYDSYMSWAALLSYEFDDQARIQEKLGLEVTQAFVYKNMSSLYADQLWFLGNIVQPLWKEIGCIFPNLEVYNKNIQANLQKIKEEIRAVHES